MISPYVYVGLQQTIVFDKMLPYKTNKISYVNIHPKSGNIFFSGKAAKEMELVVGCRVHFVILGESMYVCKSQVEGTKIFKRGKSISTQSLNIRDYTRKKLGAYQKFKCLLNATKSEFNSQPLFELKLPYRYKRSFNESLNKIQLT